MLLSRRSLIGVGAGGAALGATSVLAPAWASSLIVSSPASPAAPAVHTRTSKAVKRLAVLNLHTDERCDVVYRENGVCIDEAAQQLDRVLRDFRTGEVHPIDRELFDLLADLHDRVDGNGPFHVISGYRSPKTNAMLNKKSSGVATRSLHMDGKAIDIRLPGRALTSVRDTALAMKRGGVGYYARSDFVHVDTGRVRRW